MLLLLKSQWQRSGAMAQWAQGATPERGSRLSRGEIEKRGGREQSERRPLQVTRPTIPAPAAAVAFVYRTGTAGCLALPDRGTGLPRAMQEPNGKGGLRGAQHREQHNWAVARACYLHPPRSV